MKKAICVVSSKSFYHQTKHAIESAKKHNPDYQVILASDGIESELVDISVPLQSLGIDPEEINPTTNNYVWLVTARPAIVRYALEELNFDICVFLDGDTYTYNSFSSLESVFSKGASIVVTPHILAPLENDGKTPSINDISLMGNYNTGVFASSKSGLSFFKWWEKQTKKLPFMMVQQGVAAEQGWLRFAGDFDENCVIFRDKGYNAAYWNIAQRNLKLSGDVYYTDNDRLTIMHFSGLRKETAVENMSIYQNRYKLQKDGILYKLYDDYKKLIWG